MYRLDYHGDDYATSMYNSRRMLELADSGKLNSMSILPNMSCYKESMKYLNDKWDTLKNKPMLSVHLNLIDGYPLSDHNNPILCDEAGVINCSWERLFLYSYLPGKKHRQLKKDIRDEFRKQIKRVYDDLPEGASLRVDSHLHTHMIPIVFDAMIGALKDLKLLDKTEYIRVSDEPLTPFLNTKGVTFTYPLINIVKNRILHFLSGRVNYRLEKLGFEPGMLMGLCLSGKMDKERVDLAGPKIIEIAKKKDKYLEVLCHPGIVLWQERSEEYGPSDMNAFFSKNRNVEYDAVMKRSI
ncbi:MAG: ChbG/HpnK family deacetylase [Lachnospiraceae bacterium]|nr:ChbG/HpnK family deacetylase [Lachnospiraceae bacterium]